jgi:hypothetical protein
MTMGIKYIAVTMGYVETGSVAFLVFENQTGEQFADRESALKSLASALFQKYLLENEELSRTIKRSMFSCCERTLKLDTVAKYCSQCARWFQKTDISKEKYQIFISDMMSCCADSYGEDAPGWWPWVSILDVMRNATEDEVVSVPELGEVLLTHLITPDMVPEEFKENMQSWFSETNERNPAFDALLKDLRIS